MLASSCLVPAPPKGSYTCLTAPNRASTSRTYSAEKPWTYGYHRWKAVRLLSRKVIPTVSAEGSEENEKANWDLRAVATVADVNVVSSVGIKGYAAFAYVLPT